MKAKNKNVYKWAYVLDGQKSGKQDKENKWEIKWGNENIKKRKIKKNSIVKIIKDN